MGWPRTGRTRVGRGGFTGRGWRRWRGGAGASGSGSIHGGRNILKNAFGARGFKPFTILSMKIASRTECTAIRV